MLDEFSMLTDKHKDNYQLLGVVLFNTSHAHLIEALRKKTYIDALDEVTGENICVFWAALPEGKVEYPKFSPGLIGLMMPIYNEPSKNSELYEYFGIKDGRELPLLVTFAFNSDDELLYRKLKIKDESPDQVFNSLRSSLQEKSVLIDDFCGALKTDKEKMLSELDLFDSANTSKNVVYNLIRSIASLRSATSI